MRILFAWTGVTSYMADCWRRLQSLEGVELKVVVENVQSGSAFEAQRILGGLDFALVESGARGDVASGLLDGWRPDVVFAVGWHSLLMRDLVRRDDWGDVPKVCCFDMPWRWSLRCVAARWVLRLFLRNYEAAYVPGRVCARYARWLGFRRVETGLFSIDFEKIVAGRAGRRRDGFLYVGRYSDEKRVDIVERAHRLYSERGGTWSLDCYGQGGKFVQPDEMPRIYAEHACLLLASAFDPWPLVALEARAAGCDVVMSDRCGNRFELPGVRVVGYGSAEAMAEEMLRVEHEWKGRGETVSEDSVNVCKGIEKYDCREWAVRTLHFAEELVKGKGAV